MGSLRRVTILLLFLGVAATGAASGRVDEAIAFYDAARYAEALQVLDEIEAGSNGSAPAADERDVIDQYRALCLLALDRPAEARAVLRRLVERRPEFAFPAGELPPRFLSVVRETQADVLPSLARAEYRAGKASYDRRAYSEAERRLRRVVSLAEMDGLGPEARASIEDLADLARGFLGLMENHRVKAVASLPPATFTAPTRSAPYTAADQGVTPPVALRQELPGWRVLAGAVSTFMGGNPPKGTLEVVIDERGRVADARLSRSVHPFYDGRLLAAAKRWRYRPATKDRKP
ncbi:MAG: hypothetical protein EHM24_29865, partial [Acidobacteria bacterium]